MTRNATATAPSLLERIVAAKRAEVEALRRDAAEWRARAAEMPPPRPFAAALRAGEKVRVIAEVKRRSPSAGEITPAFLAPMLARDYERGGAAAVSVLTDRPFFGGSLADLSVIRGAVSLPVLRKDFIIDALQLWEARAAGADAVLLIVRLLDDEQLRALIALAGELGMEALVEAHDAAEVNRAVKSGATVVGLNARDLATFEVDPSLAARLAPRVTADRLLVAESGISDADAVAAVASAGVDAVLVGEALVRSADPAAMVARFAAVPRRRRA